MKTHIDTVTKLERCHTCRRSLSDRVPMIPLLTSDGLLVAVCPGCLKGTSCVNCGSTDTAETTYYGLVFCRECFNRSPQPVVTIEIDDRDLAELGEVLALYGATVETADETAVETGGVRP